MKLKRITLVLMGLAGAARDRGGTIDGADLWHGQRRPRIGRSHRRGVGQNFARRSRVTSNSSNIGFRGNEDLGAGLKAFFQIESAVNYQ